MSRTNLYSLLSFLLISSLFFACSNPFKKGKKNFEVAEYERAIENFKAASKKGNKALTNKYLAESYRLSNRIAEAEPYYKAALDANSSDDEVRFYYAYALKANGKYEEAKERFELYKSSGGNSDRIRLAKEELEDFDRKLKELQTRKSFFETETCPGINTDAAEFGAVVYNEQLLFTTGRKDNVYNGNGQPFTAIYAFDYTNKANCQGNARLFDPILHQTGTNEGSPAFAHDGSFVIFSRAGQGEKGESSEAHLYISRRSEAGWSDPELLPYPVNISQPLYEGGNEDLKGSKGDYWSATPCITPDGKRLYFSSNRPGGYGGLDLWRADINTGGRLSNIRNVGPRVNTPGDELFPFVSVDGRLFFASSGHFGLGGLDIFLAERRNGRTTVENMGRPINSKKDDFAMFFDTDTTGFFSSNRESGKGGDDIYKFYDRTPDRKKVNYFLAVNVLGRDKPGDAPYPLGKAMVEIYKGDTKHHSTKLDGLNTNEKGKTKSIPLETTQDYSLVASSEGYFKEEFDYTLAGKLIPQDQLKNYRAYEIDTTFETTVILDKIIVSQGEYKVDTTEGINRQLSIFFDFNKANIRPDAAAVLDSFAVFLNDNPNLDIELSSHTDAVGTDANNQRLSQRRADSTVAYLVRKGVKSDRLEPVGYGEKYLVVKTEAAEERNRRTEFRVTGIRRKDE